MTAEAIPTIRVRNDKRLRDKLFVPGAYAHPAKGNLYLWLEMTERYTKPGDTLLDPMAGVGSSLVAALMGRNVVCVELEPHFIAPMRASWEKMRQNPMLGYELGKVLILRGDARALPIASADAIVTSPPWAGTTGGKGEATRNNPIFNGDPGLFERHLGGMVGGYTRPDAIVTSPPFQDVTQSTDSGFLDKLELRRGGSRFQGGNRTGYTRPDAIVTSPPYEEAHQGGEDPHPERMAGSESGLASVRYTRPDAIITSPPYDNRLADKYDDGDKARMQYFLAGAESAGNIGNLRGNAYWTAMFKTYQECHRVLRPGGLMCLVLKGFTRDGKYVDLPAQTSELVQSLGFMPFDHWRRELYNLSFWRILQKRRDPEGFDDRLNYEEVHAFKKPLAGGP